MSGTTAGSQIVTWDAMPAERLGEGVERRMVVGQALMACRIHFAPHAVAAVHRHPHEQMTFVLKGRVRFTIEGEEHIVPAGGVVHFPSNVEHGATMLDEDVELVDVFTPIRQDFLK